jgi:hypothetical protein
MKIVKKKFSLMIYLRHINQQGINLKQVKAIRNIITIILN